MRLLLLQSEALWSETSSPRARMLSQMPDRARAGGRHDVRTIAVALAAVVAIFGFFIPFAFVADRIGGSPAGYINAGVIAVVAFVVLLPIARWYVSRSAEPKPPGVPPAPAQTTIVQAPVHVNVPVNVRVEKDREKPTEQAPSPTSATPIASRKRPRPKPEPSPDPTAAPRPAGAQVCDPGPHDVEPGYYMKIDLEIDPGDTVVGTLEEKDGDDFEWMIVDEDNWVELVQTGSCDVEDQGEDQAVYKVEWMVPRRGPWFLVLKAYGKKLVREVSANLRKE